MKTFLETETLIKQKFQLFSLFELLGVVSTSEDDSKETQTILMKFHWERLKNCFVSRWPSEIEIVKFDKSCWAVIEFQEENLSRLFPTQESDDI